MPDPLFRITFPHYVPPSQPFLTVKTLRITEVQVKHCLIHEAIAPLERNPFSVFPQ